MDDFGCVFLMPSDEMTFLYLAFLTLALAFVCFIWVAGGGGGDGVWDVFVWN